VRCLAFIQTSMR